jgi:hypothetical protein
VRARPWKPHERNVTSLGKPPTGREKRFEHPEVSSCRRPGVSQVACVAAHLAEDQRDEEHHGSPSSGCSSEMVPEE